MNYTGPPKFELGRVEFASGGQGGPPVSKVNVEPCIYFMLFLHGMKIVLINTIDLLTTISSSNTEMYNQYDKMTYIKCGMFRRARSILQCYGNDCRRGFDVAGKITFALWRHSQRNGTIQFSQQWVVGCIEDLRRFSGISALSRLGSRR